jgi:asparagine synthase (glutamine-hydrolysing)
MTRRHVTVALNGDGGDEVFAGYERYAAARLGGHLDVVPRAVWRALQPVARALNRRPRKGSLLQRLDRFVEAAGDVPIRRYGRWVGYFSDEQKAALLRPEFVARVTRPDSLGLLEDAYDACDARDFIDALLCVDTHTYLPGDLLVKVDIASMAFGLECRSPLLDHEVMEFGARLPVNPKLNGLSGKHLLKQFARTLVPASVLDRPKMGFGVPVDHWLRHELTDLVDDCLLGSRARDRGYFEPAVLRRYVEEHRAGRGRWHHLLWNILMMELWHREFIDGAGQVGPRATAPGVVPA